jgi:arsenite methyltransferase
MKEQNQAIKEMVKEKYGTIAQQSATDNSASCCGATACCSEGTYNIMNEDYSKKEGYAPEADLGLGCGLPVDYAKIKEGDTVIDLGSGAGNDAFVARRITGEKGKVLGIDFTPAMIEKANANTQKLGYQNVQFRLGDIDEMPVADHYADVIISNCVLNLVPDKQKVFAEVYRTLKPGGHFSISDIVLEGHLPENWKAVAELYAGCVAGAIGKEEYLKIIETSGFTGITLQKEKEIIIPENILAQYISTEEIAAYKNGGAKILSVTVYAEKPAKDERGCCTPGSGCC